MQKRLVTIALGVVIIAAPAARADDMSEARAAFAEGREHYSAGEFEAAAAAFRRANELVPNWNVLFLIGQSEAAAGRGREALEAFESYLELGGAEVPADRREIAAEKIAELKEQVGPTVDEELAALRAEEAAEEPPPEEPPPPADDDEEGPGAMKIAGIGMVAGGGAMLLAGVFTGAAALSLEGDLEDSCSDGGCGPEKHDDVDRLEGLANATDVLIFVGGGVAVAGAVLLVIDSLGGEAEASGEISFVPAVGPGLTGAALKGRF